MPYHCYFHVSCVFTSSGGSSVSQNKLPQLILEYIFRCYMRFTSVIVSFTFIMMLFTEIFHVLPHCSNVMNGV